MDIYLATEHAYHYIPQFSVDIARDRVEQKKMNSGLWYVWSVFLTLQTGGASTGYCGEPRRAILAASRFVSDCL